MFHAIPVMVRIVRQTRMWYDPDGCPRLGSELNSVAYTHGIGRWLYGLFASAVVLCFLTWQRNDSAIHICRKILIRECVKISIGWARISWNVSQLAVPILFVSRAEHSLHVVVCLFWPQRWNPRTTSGDLACSRCVSFLTAAMEESDGSRWCSSQSLCVFSDRSNGIRRAIASRRCVSFLTAAMESSDGIG